MNTIYSSIVIDLDEMENFLRGIADQIKDNYPSVEVVEAQDGNNIKVRIEDTETTLVHYLYFNDDFDLCYFYIDPQLGDYLKDVINIYDAPETLEGIKEDNVIRLLTDTIAEQVEEYKGNFSDDQ